MPKKIIGKNDMTVTAFIVPVDSILGIKLERTYEYLLELCFPFSSFPYSVSYTHLDVYKRQALLLF